MTPKPIESLDEILNKVFAYGIDWTEYKDKSEHDHDVSTIAGKIKAQLKQAIKDDLTTYITERERLASEVFIPVKGYEGSYEVSNTGKVRSVPRGRNTGVELRQNVRVRRYLCVQLSKDNVRKTFNVHRLVAEAFISNPLHKRTVNHKDSDPTNNHVDNLEWATHAENEQHAHANGKLVWNSPDRLTKLQTKEEVDE